MNNDQRKITLYTPGKIYSGSIDIGSNSLRTVDIMNSSSIYWKNPAEKGFDDALLIHQADVILEGNTKLGHFESLQIKLSEIIMFYDDLNNAGNDMEKLRAATLKARAKEEAELVHIITHTRGNSFYYITGVFYGLFKSKSKQRYMPLTKASVTEVICTGEKPRKRKIVLDGTFVGVSIHHIESCTFSAQKLKD